MKKKIKKSNRVDDMNNQNGIKYKDIHSIRRKIEDILIERERLKLLEL
ncbi:hypothetical protein [Pseudoalteromonas shioyasakiensis]|nr:hypothetical protein [Pseudoalteromonas shioyasakiensis]